MPRYNEDVVKTAYHMKQSGLSNRKIARILSESLNKTVTHDMVIRYRRYYERDFLNK